MTIRADNRERYPPSELFLHCELMIYCVFTNVASNNCKHITVQSNSISESVVVLFSQAMVKLEAFKCIVIHLNIVKIRCFLSTSFYTFPTSVPSLFPRAALDIHSGLFTIHAIRDTSCFSHPIHN